MSGKSVAIILVWGMLGLAACGEETSYSSGPGQDEDQGTPEAQEPAVVERGQHLSSCQPALSWAQTSEDFVAAPGLFAFAPHDGLLVRSAYFDHGRAFGLEDGQSLFRITQRLGEGAVTPDWNFYVEHSYEGEANRLVLRSLISQEPLASSAPLETLPGLIFSPNGDQVAALSCPGQTSELWLWSLDEEEPRLVVDWEDDGCGIWGWATGGQMQFSPDGQSLLVRGTTTGELIQVDLASGQYSAVLAHQRREEEERFSAGGPLLAMQMDPSGERAATIGTDGWLRIWSLPGLEPVGEPIPAGHSPINAMTYMPSTHAVLAWSPDGSLLAHQTPEGEVVVRDTQSWEVVLDLTRPQALRGGEIQHLGAAPVAVAFHQEMDQVALSTEQGVALWRCPDVALPAPHEGARVLLEGPGEMGVGEEATFRATHLGTDHLHGHAFWVNGELLAEPTTSREIRWTPQAPGNYEVKVSVLDGLGEVSETMQVQVWP